MPKGAQPDPPDGRRRSKARAPWGTISRRDIVEAALRSGRGSGFEQMTIRSLASELGVAPMSLYRHIRNKDDLLNDVAEELLRRSWHPRPVTKDWRSWVVEVADSLRELLVREPAALYIYLRHPVVSATARARMDAMLEVLGRAGLDQEPAQHAYAAIHTYTLGFAALEASRAAANHPAGDVPALEAQLAAYTEPEQFAIGLGLLLDGIEKTGARSAGAVPPA